MSKRQNVIKQLLLLKVSSYLVNIILQLVNKDDNNIPRTRLIWLDNEVYAQMKSKITPVSLEWAYELNELNAQMN